MMTTWFKRERQTKTPVHGADSEAISRRRGIFAAYRALIAIQMGAQLLLWVALFAYDRTMQTTWQAAVLLIAPLGLLWGLWYAGREGVQTRAGMVAGLLLLPCLMVDVALVLQALAGLAEELIPAYSPSVQVIPIVALCFITVCLGRENGVAYGVGCTKIWLFALFALGTVFSGADVAPARLWPIWGKGIGNTAMTALSGIGGVWGVALMFLLPTGKHADVSVGAGVHLSGKRWRTALWTALPWALCVIWALWCGMARPWRTGDVVGIGERLVGLARRSQSILLGELNGVMWLMILGVALAGNAMGGEKLLRRAIPKCPRSLAVAAVLLPGAIAMIFWSNSLLGFLGAILPYRAVLSAAAGMTVLIAAKKGGGR